ncbi:MAG: hypothetical protein ACREO9_07450, partial [Lysobacterales bacterium]
MNPPFLSGAASTSPGVALFSRTIVQLAVLALGTAAALQSGWANAQTPAPSLKEVTVTGNPLGATDLIAPAAQYSG